jgi:hypothetical protein
MEQFPSRRERGGVAAVGTEINNHQHPANITSLKSILIHFVSAFRVPEAASIALRSVLATPVITAVLRECEITNNITTRINLDSIRESLLEIEVKNPDHKLSKGQQSKLLNVIEMINAAEAPLNFNSAEWEEAYNQFHSVLRTCRPTELSKPMERLENFEWRKGGAAEQVLHFIVSISAWGGTQYEGAARYLGTERDANNNLIAISKIELFLGPFGFVSVYD